MTCEKCSEPGIQYPSKYGFIIRCEVHLNYQLTSEERKKEYKARLSQEIINEINGLCGKMSASKAGTLYDIDHSTVSYHWNKAGLSSPRKKVEGKDEYKRGRNPEIFKSSVKRISYEQEYKAYSKKIFIRDKVGNLLRVELRKKPIKG